MIESIAFLLLAQLAGEAIAKGLALPVPGPVLGLILMAAVIALRGIPPALHETAHGLLRNFSLLFVPAGVGVIRQVHVLAGNWLAISLALLISTAATLAVTALVFRWAHRHFGPPPEEPGP